MQKVEIAQQVQENQTKGGGSVNFGWEEIYQAKF